MNGNDADANWWAICAGTKSGCNEENLADVLAAAAAAALSILSIQVWELNADLNWINLIMFENYHKFCENTCHLKWKQIIMNFLKEMLVRMDE